MNHPTRARLLAAFVLLAMSSLAQAQYVWVNEKGQKEYSDRSPPPSIPLKNILKAPNGQPTAASIVAAPAAEAAKPAPTLAEREADYTKRQKEKTELGKKEQETQDLQAVQAQNCMLARAAKTALSSGARIRTADKDGERSFMTDAQRAVESKRVDQALAACK